LDISILKNPEGKVFFSQDDLLEVFYERLSRFPAEIVELKAPKQSTIMGLNGKPNIIPSDPIAVAKKEGMKEMLEGIISVLNG